MRNVRESQVVCALGPLGAQIRPHLQNREDLDTEEVGIAGRQTTGQDRTVTFLVPSLLPRLCLLP